MQTYIKLLNPMVELVNKEWIQMSSESYDKKDKMSKYINLKDSFELQCEFPGSACKDDDPEYKCTILTLTAYVDLLYHDEEQFNHDLNMLMKWKSRMRTITGTRY